MKVYSVKTKAPCAEEVVGIFIHIMFQTFIENINYKGERILRVILKEKNISAVTH